MEEEIHTIEEDAIISGVASLNGQTGDLNIKTVNNQSILGTGNINIEAGVTSINGQTGNVTLSASDVGAQAPLTTDQLAAVNSGIDSTKVEAIASNTSAISGEANARELADNNLQSQIDGIAASSDVTDIVGTYAQLEAYDTTHLKDNDIIKVLQDESQNDETTYYRWSTTTEAFTLIGEEGPYYTKSQTDTLLGAKQDDLIAGTNITIAADGKTISATDTTYSAFTGTDGTSAGSAGLVPAPATTDAGKYLKADGSWGTVSAGPTVVQTTGTSTTDVMSQNAVTSMVFSDPSSMAQVRIGASANAGSNSVAIGYGANAQGARAVALGTSSTASKKRLCCNRP